MLLFVSKDGAYPSKQISGAPMKVSLLALSTNITLTCKDLPGTITVAYSEN
jgi:hypothetical protein